MRQKNIKGQEAVEFILITTLVFLGTLVVIFVFGDKIANFFNQDSAVTKNSKGSTPLIAPGSQPKYMDDFETKVAPDAFDSYNSVINADGSVSFKVGEQNITLPKDVIDLHNVVLQTTGSSGVNDLIQEVAMLVQAHASEFPPGAVPVEISFGIGSREKATANYTGLATVAANITNIQVGNSLVIIQKDQTCTGASCKKDNIGKYRIAGTVDSSNVFTGSVGFTSDSMSTSYTNKGSYTGTISTDANSKPFVDGSYGTGNGSWEFSFNSTKYTL